MQVKTCPATIKAAGTNEGTDDGVFEAIVAAYNVDSVGDRIMPGAFKKTLEAWRESGDPIPVLWAHKSDDPEYHIGHVLEAEERPEGLWVKAQIDIDDPRSKSAKVYRLLKGRRVRQFSFAYDEVDARPAQKDDSGAQKDLHELKVYEVGPCLIGANQATSLLDVKQDPTLVTVNVQQPAPVVEEKSTAAETAAKIADSATDLKAGRILSKQNEDRVAEIARLAQELLASVQKSDEDPSTDSNAEKATPAAEPAAAPAPEAKSSEPAQHGTASERMRIELDLLEVELDSFTL